jgi:hypothetical protein
MINGLRHHDDHESRACSAVRSNRSYPTNRTPPELASALGHVPAKGIAVAVGVDADRDQRVDVDDAAALADLLGQGIDPDERVRAGVPASADIRASANFLTITRRRSGLAAAMLSSARACRGTQSDAVIVLISFKDLVFLKDQPVAVRPCGRYPDAGAKPRIRSNPYTTPVDATSASTSPLRRAVFARRSPSLQRAAARDANEMRKVSVMVRSRR